MKGVEKRRKKWLSNVFLNFGLIPVLQVYIFGGNLHVIPIPQTPTEVTQFPLFTPSVEEALDIICNSSLNTVAPQVVQTTLRRRIDQYVFVPGTGGGFKSGMGIIN